MSSSDLNYRDYSHEILQRPLPTIDVPQAEQIFAPSPSPPPPPPPPPIISSTITTDITQNGDNRNRTASPPLPPPPSQQQQQQFDSLRPMPQRTTTFSPPLPTTSTPSPPPPSPPVASSSPSLSSAKGYHRQFQQQSEQLSASRSSSPPMSEAARKEQWKANVNSAISATVGENPGICAFLLTIISVILIIVTLPFSMFLCVKVVQEYERAVIFRLGRLVKGGSKGPGIFFIIPCIDSYCKVDLRTVSFDVPPQEILSRDSVTVAVDAVVYYRISNATVAVSNVEDYGRSTRLLAATTLRNVLGTKDLSQILSERESISHVMQSSLDEATDPWGVKVERVEIKDVRLPVQLQRAMAAEAEAAREARAKVIAAEGEQRASRALKEAAEVMTHNPAALQLRYLQTLSSIAGEKNSTIVFPIPMELFRCMMKNQNNDSK